MGSQQSAAILAILVWSTQTVTGSGPLTPRIKGSQEKHPFEVQVEDMKNTQEPRWAIIIKKMDRLPCRTHRTQRADLAWRSAQEAHETRASEEKCGKHRRFQHTPGGHNKGSRMK